MEKFSFGIMVRKNADIKEGELFDTITVHRIHACGVVAAGNKNEAFGKANEIGLRLYPPKDGYFGHHVVLGGIDPIEPEKAVRVQN